MDARVIKKRVCRSWLPHALPHSVHTFYTPRSHTPQHKETPPHSNGAKAHAREVRCEFRQRSRRPLHRRGPTRYTYPAHFQCRVRARRGDDVRAERCLWVGRNQALLGSVIGSHVADFPFFLPIRETGRPRLKSTIRALARQHGGLVQSSRACELATGLEGRPRALGMHIAPPIHPCSLP